MNFNENLFKITTHTCYHTLSSSRASKIHRRTRAPCLHTAPTRTRGKIKRSAGSWRSLFQHVHDVVDRTTAIISIVVHVVVVICRFGTAGSWWGIFVELMMVRRCTVGIFYNCQSQRGGKPQPSGVCAIHLCVSYCRMYCN